MERPAHLAFRRRRFSPANIAALSGALVLQAAALYAFATGLMFHGFRFFPQAVDVEFLTNPPPAPHLVLPQLQLVPPPTPTITAPEIEIHIPKPAPRIRAARITRHAAPPVRYVQIVAPPAPPAAPPAPPRPRGITAPVSIGASHNCDRQYPFITVRMNQQGTTVVRFMVNTDGRVSNVHVARSSGHEMLDDAAIRCAWAWRYRPAFEDGRPVPAPWTTNVQWKLHNGLPAT